MSQIASAQSRTSAPPSFTLTSRRKGAIRKLVSWMRILAREVIEDPSMEIERSFPAVGSYAEDELSLDKELRSGAI